MTCPGSISQEGAEWRPSLIWTNVKLTPHGPREETQPGPEGSDGVSQPRALTPPWAALWRPASLGRCLCLDPYSVHRDTCCVLQSEQGMSK